MEKIPLLLLFILIGVLILVAIVGYQLIKVLQVVSISILIIFFGAFLSQIFRPSLSPSSSHPIRY